MDWGGTDIITSSPGNPTRSGRCLQRREHLSLRCARAVFSCLQTFAWAVPSVQMPTSPLLSTLNPETWLPPFPSRLSSGAASSKKPPLPSSARWVSASSASRCHPGTGLAMDPSCLSPPLACELCQGPDKR